MKINSIVIKGRDQYFTLYPRFTVYFDLQLTAKDRQAVLATVSVVNKECISIDCEFIQIRKASYNFVARIVKTDSSWALEKGDPYASKMGVKTYRESLPSAPAKETLGEIALLMASDFATAYPEHFQESELCGAQRAIDSLEAKLKDARAEVESLEASLFLAQKRLEKAQADQLIAKQASRSVKAE